MTTVNWRDMIAVHPACAAIPDMDADQFEELAKDARKRSDIVQPIVKWRGADAEPWQLLDGRHRLDALALLPDGAEKVAAALQRCVYKGPDTDPWQYSLSVNLTRRHLTAEQKREVVAKLLRANPKQSNRLVAAAVKVNDKTVANVRKDLEDGAEIPHHDKRVGSDGVAQPATKPQRQPPATVVHNTTPRPAPVSKEQRLRAMQERSAASAAAGQATLADEIAAFRDRLNSLRSEVERIERPTRLRLARGLVVALGIDPAEFGTGGSP